MSNLIKIQFNRNRVTSAWNCIIEFWKLIILNLPSSLKIIKQAFSQEKRNKMHIDQTNGRENILRKKFANAIIRKLTSLRKFGYSVLVGNTFHIFPSG